MNGSTGEWLRTPVGVRQGCLLLTSFFNIFLERIISDGIEEHDRKVSLSDRTITSLRFANDLDDLAVVQQAAGTRSLSGKSQQNLPRYKNGDMCGKDQT